VRPRRSLRRVFSIGLTRSLSVRRLGFLGDRFRPAPSSPRRGGRIGGGRLQAGALFDQGQLHFLDRHDLVGHRVEAFEQLDRAFGIGAADDEFLAAPEDGDVERGRDLAQVLVERAAQVGEPRVIERLGNEVRRLGGRLVFHAFGQTRPAHPLPFRCPG
jgi:hypothetical protein